MKEQNRDPERDAEGLPSRRPSNGEVAGGSRDDAPGGAYNVPEEMIEEVGDEEAERDRPGKP
ncbi:hypothetical protein [Stutzerimonas azotifigens]|uniref:hypothetical protein n=1 Tax=Stutzerimonas azotifigens TaxID=291995 RepID=UPI00041EF590|nr:hypothetical protein [Stutzerimonas azotifigens]